jgi:DNA-binding response OmpR family regulator
VTTSKGKYRAALPRKRAVGAGAGACPGVNTFYLIGSDSLKKILVVEDDSLLNKTICYNLTLAGYTADAALSAVSARGFIEKQEYDLTVLDVNLPDGDGFTLCREIKSRYENAAVIFLTARDMESDMLKGFELGADDYVTKPFPNSVFQKKVAALFSRITKQTGGDYYDDGNLIIDFSEATATLAGCPILFTSMDYRLLKVLVKNPRIVLTRQVLLEKLWDIDENFVDEHALTCAVSRIRGKIETSGYQYVKTVYGMGYMWIGGGKK